VINARKVNRKHTHNHEKIVTALLSRVTTAYMTPPRTAIIIPARYGSTRLPAKPLALIAGQTMLSRVVNIARAAAANSPHITVCVATDDERIATHCRELDVDYVMTDPACASGTDRVAAAVEQLPSPPDFILNLQGDAPLTPPDFLSAMIKSFASAPCDIITPVTQLSWAELDNLRESKRTTPLSGTCAVFQKETGRALWFSKQIIPAIRSEANLRAQSPFSPVHRHIGLYGYSCQMLTHYSSLPESEYEKLEGLEQLRALEQGYTIRCVPVSYAGRANMSGVDSAEDIARAEALIVAHGELLGNAEKA
jgi:3-deoxy-manno-octulosonate cytidylyltransferase (CMP-KDO synthetase)